jgi:hypothetical protein
MRKIAMCLTTIIVSGLLAAFMVGCETSSSVSYAPVTISPASATSSVGSKTNTIEFVASGGDGSYVWSVDTPALGSLAVSNETAIYTSTMAVGVNRINVRSNGQNATATVSQY